MLFPVLGCQKYLQNKFTIHNPLRPLLHTYTSASKLRLLSSSNIFLLSVYFILEVNIEHSLLFFTISVIIVIARTRDYNPSGTLAGIPNSERGRGDRKTPNTINPTGQSEPGWLEFYSYC